MFMGAADIMVSYAIAIGALIGEVSGALERVAALVRLEERPAYRRAWGA